MTRLPWLALLAACGGDARPAPPPVGEAERRACAEVGDHVAAITQRELVDRARLRSLLGPVIGELAPTITAACIDDRWSDEARACVLAAGSYDAGEACLAKLPLGARRALEVRLTLLVKRGMARARS